MITSNKTYFIDTIGCQMNEADSLALAAELESRGYRPAPRAEAADLVIVNTCVVRKLAEDKSLNRIYRLRHLKQQRPELRIAVMGCFVGKSPKPDLRNQFPFVDFFLPPSDPRGLLEWLDAARPSEQPAEEPSVYSEGCEMESCGFSRIPPSYVGRIVSTFVPVVLGCSCACAFCVIPYRRGPERSRSPDRVLQEIKSLAEQGIREVILLGQIVDRYGVDLGGGVTLAKLLREAEKIEGIVRIRFLTSHPKWFTDELLDVMAESSKVCPHVELPIQSGDDEILKRMRRGYTGEEYRRLIGRIRDRIPECGLYTDVIVGFPGETEEQFMNTYRLMEELRPDMIRIAMYSERPGTYAARHYTDDVPAEEKKRRHMMLEDLLSEYLIRKHAAYQGATVEIFVDAREKDGRWRGRTSQGKLVFFRDERDWLGKLAQVRITWTSAFSLAGELIA